MPYQTLAIIIVPILGQCARQRRHVNKQAVRCSLAFSSFHKYLTGFLSPAMTFHKMKISDIDESAILVNFNPGNRFYKEKYLDFSFLS